MHLMVGQKEGDTSWRQENFGWAQILQPIAWSMAQPVLGNSVGNESQGRCDCSMNLS